MANESARPASLDGEVVILGACLLEPDAVNVATELLEPEDFSLDSHRRIFACIAELAEIGEPVDHTIVVEELLKRKQLVAVGDRPYLMYLTEGIPRRLNIANYCRIVKDKAVLRSIMSTCDVATARASDQSEAGASILEDLESSILELTQVYNQQAFGTILDAARDAGGVDAFVSKMCDPLAMTGLETGFEDFDKMTGGLQSGELVIIAARPSVGKSALAINIAQNVVRRDAQKVVAIFSLEMSKDSLYLRMVASAAEVSGRRAAQGFISATERQKIASAVLAMADRKLMIDDSASMTTTQMRAKCRRLKQKEGRLDLIEVDYIQLVTGSKRSGNREQEVASISRGLKALAKEMKCPVVALSQLSRATEQRSGDKRPMLSDLRESGSLEQDADVVAFIHRPEMYDRDNDDIKGLAELIVAKQRSGPTGTVNLAYLSDITTFNNLAKGF